MREQWLQGMKSILSLILVALTFNLDAQSTENDDQFNIGFGWGSIVSRSTSTVANLTSGLILELKSNYLKAQISNGSQDTMCFETACNSVKFYFEVKDSLETISTKTFWDCDYSGGYGKDILLPNEIAIIHFPIFSELKGTTARIKLISTSGTFYSDWLVI